MASALRPTPETGRVAATKMPASAIGPSWTKRAGREARLAFRQAQRSGDRAGAMRIAMQAEEAGLPAQASIGSAERRLAGQYQGRGADTAITAEVASALTPPPPAMASGQPRLADEFVEQAQTPAATPVPGATEPPENPVSGSRVPATGDAESRLGATPRRWSPALQGIAGRRALSDNLRKSIEAGGGDLSGDRLKRAKAEADRLGITDEQFLDELQDLGVSMPAADLDSIRPRDNRSLDRRLRDYQDEYLGGGPSSEMSARLRADANTNRMAAEGMRRAREQTATRERTPAPSPAPAPPAPPPASASTTRRQPAPLAPSRSTVVGGSPPTPTPKPEPPRALYGYTMTSPEARLARLRTQGQEKAAADAARRRQANADIEARLAERRRNIRVPDWQQGTILGDLNRRLQEFSINASR